MLERTKRPFNKNSKSGPGGGKGKGRDLKERRAPRIMRTPVDLPEVIDYKDIATLRKMLSERGKMLSRRFTGVSANEQRLVSLAIKRARFLGLLPSGSAKRK
jgi:ribosomal protein S18